MSVERMGCGCLTSVYRDAGKRVHEEECIFNKDHSLMVRMYYTYLMYMDDHKDKDVPRFSYEGWLKNFDPNFKD